MTDTGYFTIKDLIFTRDQDPDHHAIESPGLHPLTYRDLRIQILYVIKTLNTRGFHRKDRIAVITPPGPETAVITVAVMAGFTLISLNPQNKQQEYERYFSHLNINAIIVQKGDETAATTVATSRGIPVFELAPVSGTAGKFEMEPAVVQNAEEAEFATSSDIANMLLTSGTTAEPKTVSVLQRNFCIIRQRQNTVLKITGSDRCLHIVPYYHGMGIGLPLLGILSAGGTVICVKDFIPSDFFFLLKTYRPTLYTAGPALHQGILREIKKIPPGELKNNSLRCILTGSMSMTGTVNNELETFLGVPVIEYYASSEAGTISINFPPKPGSVGIPVVGHLDILDENDNLLGPYEQGEIVVKDETICDGYCDAPDESRAVFMSGGYRTGDTGYLDDEGYLFLTGRKKELINKGGTKISPEEIDTVLKTHPGVRDAMTFGVSDPVLGEDIEAVVVPADAPVTEAELRYYLLDRLIQFKVPRRIHFVDAIPRNAVGKPLRYVGTKRFS
jgi:acyl-CoA synthetase (AMP-forming)/AMP-acid ligase II